MNTKLVLVFTQRSTRICFFCLRTYSFNSELTHLPLLKLGSAADIDIRDDEKVESDFQSDSNCRGNV